MTTIDKILAEISAGELVDKITILEIKQDNIKDTNSLVKIQKELSSLKSTLTECVNETPALKDLTEKLKQINKVLWDVEDDIRQCERDKNFGEEFIELARKVYFTNDKRAQLKKEINALTNSSLEEVKSYQSY